MENKNYCMPSFELKVSDNWKWLPIGKRKNNKGIPVCVRMWMMSSSARIKLLPQSAHQWGRSPVCNRICVAVDFPYVWRHYHNKCTCNASPWSILWWKLRNPNLLSENWKCRVKWTDTLNAFLQTSHLWTLSSLSLTPSNRKPSIRSHLWWYVDN